MLVVMRSDSMISAKGFKAQYVRACGARIIVKDHGFLTPSSGYTDVHYDTNCTWTLIAENPGKYNSTFVLIYIFAYGYMGIRISSFILTNYFLIIYFLNFLLQPIT